MFQLKDYTGRGYNFIHNKIFNESKRLSSLMLYTTDLCDSACKHCLIWAKRPAVFLPMDEIVKTMSSRCVRPSTMIGLEGGEFMLHPEADKILEWFSKNHKNYDVFSNCLKPDSLIEAVLRYKPHRLYVSLDGDEDTYRYMRGKDGYAKVLSVIKAIGGKIPVFVMFTLSPYNNLDDLQHVAEICNANNVFLRVGIYNNIPFFDTIDKAAESPFGLLKTQDMHTFKKVKDMQRDKEEKTEKGTDGYLENSSQWNYKVPEILKQFEENYDYVKLYTNWNSKKLRIKCHSILDSLIILPNGDVPICQGLDKKIGNIYKNSLDEIFNSEESIKEQNYHSQNCNQCWVSYHRKYDIILYRTFEKYFGKWATSKMLGYYKWDEDDAKSYKKVMKD
jgi:MoaA/NifB/PqqE/SkfB family radical SAM enzyme